MIMDNDNVVKRKSSISEDGCLSSHLSKVTDLPRCTVSNRLSEIGQDYYNNIYKMGNECPECETPANECKMRDVFKEQPRNRTDLDLSQIKKKQYKRKAKQSELDEADSSDIPDLIVESRVVQKDSKKMFQSEKKPKKEHQASSEHKKENVYHSTHSIKKPLTLDNDNHTLYLKKGVKYIGSTVEDQPHEKGKVIWEDGSTVIGTFFLGQLAEHQKIYLETANGISFEGQVLEGKAHATGKLNLPDSSSYEGEFRQDLPHGIGKHKMTDGSFYEGHFQKGSKSGKGKLYFPGGMYEGSFSGDRFQGHGILILDDGRTIKGVWKEGVLDGQGEIEWESGERYVGSFSNNQRHGNGTYWYADGRQWSGEWENDMQNGFGCYVLPDGQSVKGIWVQGVKTDEMRDVGASRA